MAMNMSKTIMTQGQMNIRQATSIMFAVGGVATLLLLMLMLMIQISGGVHNCCCCRKVVVVVAAVDLRALFSAIVCALCHPVFTLFSRRYLIVLFVIVVTTICAFFFSFVCWSSSTSTTAAITHKTQRTTFTVTLLSVQKPF